MTENRISDLLAHMRQAATKIMDRYPEFAAQHPAIPRRSIRGMRNRIAHGYFDINLDLVWETVETALPNLLTQLAAVDGN